MLMLTLYSPVTPQLTPLALPAESLTRGLGADPTDVTVRGRSEENVVRVLDLLPPLTPGVGIGLLGKSLGTVVCWVTLA